MVQVPAFIRNASDLWSDWVYVPIYALELITAIILPIVLIIIAINSIAIATGSDPDGLRDDVLLPWECEHCLEPLPPPKWNHFVHDNDIVFGKYRNIIAVL